MLGIYSHIPEANHVSWVYSVANILQLQFMIHVTLLPKFNISYFCISAFRSTRAVPNMAVFCSSLISCFPSMLLCRFLDESETVPAAPTVTGVTLFLHFICAAFLFKFFTVYNLLGFSLNYISASLDCNIH
jgi:hypothetical protein